MKVVVLDIDGGLLLCLVCVCALGMVKILMLDIDGVFLVMICLRLAW